MGYFTAFKEDSFDTVQRINETIGDPADDDSLDRSLAALTMKLNLLSQEQSLSCESSMSQFLSTIPKSIQQINNAESSVRLIQGHLSEINKHASNVHNATLDELLLLL